MAIVMPALWRYCKNEKSEKLAQYGARVWNIPESDTEKMADEAINAKVAFFEQLGVKTRLSDYDLGDEAIAEVIRKLKEHGHIALGEHGKITAREAEALLKMAL
ncbi:iron-containing alcohol dehydrogenase [Enterobacter vonholyi]|uniref:iron-containing alcohol dehydrogenase n=1 Tax=Enterobacter vonholyi TaxID=2797505 RepID=UPI0024BF0B55|nr:iron-containing alcohol dehydrogenase [Enterobacter vonholyi]